MKKITLIVSMMFLMATASAAGIHGEYKGYPVVEVTANGKNLTVEDTPAIMLDGRTMVPIYMLRELGANVVWYGSSQTVDVKLPNERVNEVSQSKDLLKEIQNLMLQNRDDLASFGLNIIDISFEINEASLKTIKYIYKPSIGLSNELYFSNLMLILISNHFLDLEVDQSTVYISNGTSIMGSVSVKGEMINYIVNSDNPDREVEVFLESLDVYIDSDYHNSPLVLPLSQITSPKTVSANYPELYSYDDKTYLGKITTNIYDFDSVFNEFGSYGSAYSATSIWNEFGDYGSAFSNTSAFNEFAMEPPVIMLDGEPIGFVTLNTMKPGAISPYSLFDWSEDQGF